MIRRGLHTFAAIAVMLLAVVTSSGQGYRNPYEGNLPSARERLAEARTAQARIISLNGGGRALRDGVVDQSASPFCIPLQASVTPTGARTYAIPIESAPCSRMAPGLSLVYSSQSGEGIAGYGWHLSGIPSITLGPSTLYYQGRNSAPDVYSSDHVFYLDGNVLVPTQETGEIASTYTLETATGHILVSMHTDGVCVTGFTVLYPDGRRAEFTALAQYGDGATCCTVYPMASMTDADGNVMTVDYDQSAFLSDGVAYPTAVEYNYGHEGVAASRTEFTYSDIPDACATYNAGRLRRNVRILSSITVRDRGEDVMIYRLTHREEYGCRTLSELGLSSGEEHLPPLRFTYNDGLPTMEDENDFLNNGSVTMLAWMSGSNVVQQRGKFLPGLYADGMLAYPQKSIYTAVGSVTHWFKKYTLYGSGYSASDPILLQPLINSAVYPRIIRAEEGFQSAVAIDVDEDGRDEIVKVNFNGVQGSNTILSIKRYWCRRTGSSFSVDSTARNVAVQGVYDDKNAGIAVSPQPRFYLYGHFRGNSTGTQLLTISFNEGPDGSSMQSRTALIDLASGQKTEDVCFDVSPDDADKRFLAADLDGDGRTELLYADTYFVYEYVPSSQVGVTFTRGRLCSGLLSSDFLNRDRYLADINGDGLTDLVFGPSSASSSSSWRLCLNKGDGTFSSDQLTLVSDVSSKNFLFMDVNRDSYADLLYYPTNVSGRVKVVINENGALPVGSAINTNLIVSSSQNLIPANIHDRGDCSNLIVADGTQVTSYRYGVDRRMERLLTVAENSFGVRQINVYSLLTSPESDEGGVYRESASLQLDSTDRYSRRALPIPLLASSGTYADALGLAAMEVEQTLYGYTDAIWNNYGLGFCGFTSMLTTDGVNRISTTVRMSPEMRGVPTRVTASLLNASEPFYEQVNHYSNRLNGHGGRFPRLSGSEVWDNLKEVYTDTNLSYGRYDLPTTVRTERLPMQGEAQDVITDYTYNTYQNIVGVDRYMIGLPLHVRNATYTRVEQAECNRWQTAAACSYDARGHLIERRQYVGQPTSSMQEDSLVVTTRWTYDGSGNVLSESSAPYRAAVFTGSSFTYDQDGRFLMSQTSPLGLVTGYGDYAPCGGPREVTDPHGNVTRYSYDRWGNTIGVSYPTGASETTRYEWGGTGLYKVTQETGSGGSVITQHDVLGRVMRTSSMAPDGNWRSTDSRYDSRRQLSLESLPFVSAPGAVSAAAPSGLEWTSYSYDAYGRPTATVHPSGRQTLTSYDGQSITETSDGIPITRTADVAGRVVSAGDPGGTTIYILRADGQPEKIVASGVVTSFTYDGYGRRRTVTDSSSGTVTDTYAPGSDGSMTWSRTNADGTVRTTTDRFGRVTTVDRVGEYLTTMAYDAFGRLSSETATSGHSRTYAYDSFDRPTEVHESISGGPWITRTYSYGGDGLLSATSYQSGTGQVGSLTYSYEHGQYTSTLLHPAASGSAAATVLDLEAFDSFGRPTRAVTGGAVRSYSYNSLGQTLSRSLAPAVSSSSAVMDLATVFSPTSGNLLSRTDVTRSLTETFTYDALNRLTSSHGGTLTYSSSGNILTKDGDMEMEYADPQHPYRVTSLTIPLPEDFPPMPADTVVVADSLLQGQWITYNASGRPLAIGQGEYHAVFSYGIGGKRIRMTIHRVGEDGPVLERYYLADGYEVDIVPGGRRERMYLCGDAYSAPMVYARDDLAPWTLYNIGRDHLGSVRVIASADGANVLAEYAYDPWGRLCDPATLEPYAQGEEPVLMFGRGFTGHEHLPWFGLINMNARLYDPLCARFLSPDPFVQAPCFSQSFNRYSYCLNNPLVYVDESGEVAVVFVALAIAAGNMLLDYGIQVAINYIKYRNDHSVTTKDILFNKIDWFDIGISGLVGGLTGGFGVAAGSGQAVGKIGSFVLNNAKKIKWGEALLTSVVDITGEGFQKISANEFWVRLGTAAVTMAATEYLTNVFSTKNTNANISQDSELPLQNHHFATNKNSKFTPILKGIADKYGLDLDGDWNRAMMQHLGRHPNEYHRFVLRTMRQIDEIAAGDPQKFLELYDLMVKQYIINNPRLLRKTGW